MNATPPPAGFSPATGAPPAAGAQTPPAVERSVFAADLHLHPGHRPEQNRLLARFLERCAGATRLVLVGDVFTCWYERRGRHVGDYEAVFALFRAAAEAGLAIHHVIGNHDFVLGAGVGDGLLPPYRGYHLGWVRGGPSVLTRHGIQSNGPGLWFDQAGARVLCAHGDQFCTASKRYMWLRWILQGPFGRTGAALIPFAVAAAIVRLLQRKGGRVALPFLADEGRGIQDTAVAPQVAAGADWVICGHLHFGHARTVRIGGGTGRLVVLPPWFETGGYGELHGASMTTRDTLDAPPHDVSDSNDRNNCKDSNDSNAGPDDAAPAFRPIGAHAFPMDRRGRGGRL